MLTAETLISYQESMVEGLTMVEEWNESRGAEHIVSWERTLEWGVCHDP